MKDEMNPQSNETEKPKTTEQELRNAESPWPKTPGELIDYIQKICDENGDDYGKCVYAMSLSAVAAFNFASHLVGATGFQASCADLDIIRRTRGMKCPFAIIKADDMLFPQYDINKNVKNLIAEWTPWAAEQARKKIDAETMAAPAVLKHWEKLARKAKKETT